MEIDGPMPSFATDMAMRSRRIGFDLGGSESPRADKRFGGELEIVTAEKSGGRSGTATTTNLPVRSLVHDDHAPAPGSSHAARENGVMEIGDREPSLQAMVDLGRDTINDLEIKKDIGKPDESFSNLSAVEMKKFVNARDYQNAVGIVQQAKCIVGLHLGQDHGNLIATAHKGRAILYCRQCGFKEFPTPAMCDGRLAEMRDNLQGLISESSLQMILAQFNEKQPTMADLMMHVLAQFKKAE